MIKISGKLYICPTPLGNLADITLRVLDTLKDVDLIAVEDTRHTKKLLSHYQIRTKLVSYHQHSSAGQIQRLIDQLLEGKNIALVSDAGTPGISDPGQELIAQCINVGVEVDPLPGPCAATTALSGSGFPMASFSFQGFLPRKGLETAVSKLMDYPHPVVLYESPRRVEKLLQTLQKIMPHREILLARELTKVHQQYLRGTAEDLLETLEEENAARGEFTIVLGPWEKPKAEVSQGDILSLASEYSSQGLSNRDIASKIAEETGIPRREVYGILNKS